MSDHKAEVRKRLVAAGLLPSPEAIEAKKQLAAILQATLANVDMAPTSHLIMFLDMHAIIAAEPDSADEAFAERALDQIATAIDRRFPVPTRTRCSHRDEDDMRCMKPAGHDGEHTEWAPVEIHPGGES